MLSLPELQEVLVVKPSWNSSVSVFIGASQKHLEYSERYI